LGHAASVGIWLNFSYGAYFLHGQPTADNAIRITAYPAEDSFGQIAEDWRPGETIVNVAGRIHDGLRKTGNDSQANDRPNWSLALRNVQRALGATLSDDAKIAGKLHRLVGDLAITDGGVEHLDGRLLVPVADGTIVCRDPMGSRPKEDGVESATSSRRRRNYLGARHHEGPRPDRQWEAATVFRLAPHRDVDPEGRRRQRLSRADNDRRPRCSE
jgi:hypothetical protein